MLTDKHFKELEENGYSVVSDVIPPEECDAAIREYRKWLSQFRGTSWPRTFHGIINWFNTGHMTPTWEMRLKTKKVFSQLWKTDKLLTSFDAISIGRPPEHGQEKFETPGEHWLHTDQIATRLGLHAYQGALYLEEQSEDDWTFHVLEGSHNHLDSFYDHHPQAVKKSEPLGYYHISPEEMEFFKEAGVTDIVRVPVPKGGMVLWDSRLVHANARPLYGRKNPGRWRFALFVSMTPAIWASEKDIRDHKGAYESAWMTSHWSSTRLVPFQSRGQRNIVYPKVVPDIAKTEEAKKLSGAIPYDFEDGEPNGGDYRPKWRV